MRNTGWGKQELGLVKDYTHKNGGYMYVGKPESKAIKFYKEVYCKNNNVLGIPIEDDDGVIGHLEEGFDNEGNFEVRVIDGIEHYPVPYEIMSTYHTTLSVTSPLSIGILEDYGFVINWDHQELKLAEEIFINKNIELKDKSAGQAITEYYSDYYN